MRQGSLKAWKTEQDAIKMEEDEKERARSAKRSVKSAKKVRENLHFVQTGNSGLLLQ